VLTARLEEAFRVAVGLIQTVERDLVELQTEEAELNQMIKLKDAEGTKLFADLNQAVKQFKDEEVSLKKEVVSMKTALIQRTKQVAEDEMKDRKKSSGLDKSKAYKALRIL
jgi:hypothetical protein